MQTFKQVLIKTCTEETVNLSFIRVNLSFCILYFYSLFLDNKDIM